MPTATDPFFTFANQHDRLGAAFPDLFGPRPDPRSRVRKIRCWYAELRLLRRTELIRRQWINLINEWNEKWIAEYTEEHGEAPNWSMEYIGPSALLTAK